MPRVVCSLPNASHMINGVRFASLGDGGGMLSEEIPEHIAAEFLAIKGYVLHETPVNAKHYETKADKVDSKLRAVPATQKESA